MKLSITQANLDRGRRLTPNSNPLTEAGQSRWRPMLRHGEAKTAQAVQR
jgi:hypothetical protein